jgi:flagellar biosynthesis chaperone FliJ
MVEYPLEQLVIIKQKKLEEAERNLQEKKRLLAEAEEKLRKVEAERDKVKTHKDDKLAQLRQTLDEGSTSDKIQQMKQYLKVVDEELKQKETKVKEQKKLVDAAEKNVETARQELFEKQKDVEKLSLHKKEWEKEMRAWAEQEAAIETDELGSGMHTRKKRHTARHKKNHKGK